MPRQISTENWLRRITHPHKSFSQLMNESGLNPERWITLKEAANRLGMSESGAWKAAIKYGWLENCKVGRRRLVEKESVERFRIFRESRKSRPARRSKRRQPDDRRWTIDDDGLPPPVVSGPSSLLRPHLHTPTHPYALQQDGRLWRDPANDDIWVPVDRAANVLLIGKDQIGQLALHGKIRRKWQHKATGEEIRESRIQFRGRPAPDGKLAIENCQLSIENPRSEIHASTPPHLHTSSPPRTNTLSTINRQPSTRSGPAASAPCIPCVASWH